MKEKQKVEFIVKTLDRLYPDPEITLRFSSPYTFLISVLLSAQSTDKRVNETTPALFARADTPDKMIKLTDEEVISLVRPVGLAPTKGRNIRALSAILVEKYGGEVPRTFEQLEALPGVGHKTASVVMSQAFGVPAFPVDTHIHRLMTRWGLTCGKSVEQTEKDAKRLFPEELWNKLHLQIIYYGREYSPARGLDLSRDVITAVVTGKMPVPSE
ncbi:MAG: endonuclease III [Flavobacteriales bacterium]|nr:endonuclease III [Flavobacteriales bacterium]PWM13021.1 MAG: endonuclease III [Flavobacteriales bacterium]